MTRGRRRTRHGATWLGRVAPPLLTVLGLALVLFAARRSCAGEPLAPPVEHAADEPVVAVRGEAMVVAAATAPDREAIESPSLEVATVATRPDPSTPLVQLSGRVVRAGLPLRGAEISFFAARDAWHGVSADWTITDGDGRYEVELPSDNYLVDLHDEGTLAAVVVVLPEPAHQRHDLTLPPR